MLDKCYTNNSTQNAYCIFIFQYTTDQQGQEHLVVHPQQDPLLKGTDRWIINGG